MAKQIIKQVTKSAEQIKNDAEAYYRYLIKKTKEMENELAVARSKMDDTNISTKQRESIRLSLSYIKSNHTELSMLETILYK